MNDRIMHTTAVFLTDEEISRFIQFQKHYNLIGLLASVKAFDIRNGNVTIHFNINGEIKSLKKEEFYAI